jgi:glycosyltransferase involved in cell wall biosynthesis
MPTAALTFLLPAGSERITGGNLYNQRLLAALRGRTPVDARPATGYAPRGGTVLVDTLDLASVRGWLGAAGGTRAVLLVHYLHAIDPAVADDAPPSVSERSALPLFDGFVTTSELARCALIGLGLPAPRILALSPPAPPPAAPRPCPTAPRAGLVGNLSAVKGVLELLDALAQRLTPRDRLELDVFGRLDLDAAYGAACVRRVRDEPALAGRVRLRGPLAPEDVPCALAQAAFAISAARMETFGMALQEYRAAGLPVLARAAGNAAAHVADGRTGGLYGTPEALADGVVALSRDPARLRALFAAAQAERPPGESWAQRATTLLAWIDLELR